MKRLAVDLFCGLGGWTEGLIAEGFRVFGFDIERHKYGETRYPAQLVIQDVLTIHGSQFKDAAVIVASPPCQAYSYLAMPWSRSSPVKCGECEGTGKDPRGVRMGQDHWPCSDCEGTGKVHNSKAAKDLRRKWETEGPDNRLFDACFRIQREAIEATRNECEICDSTGHTQFGFRDCEPCNGTGYTHRFIPLIVENVRGAQPWVGKAKANFGSFHLWGDVAQVGNRIYVTGADGMPVDGGMVMMAKSAYKVPGFRFDVSGGSFQTAAVNGVKTTGHINKRDGHGHTRHLTNQAESDAVLGTKIGGDWFSDPNSTCRKHGSRSNARKAASAIIAKIPLPLSQYVAQSVKSRCP